MMNRRQLADRAIELVGGITGYTKSHDPHGCFKLVTEGRQQTWKDPKTGATRSYSACEDLVTELALEACEMKQRMTWCNRVNGGNKWIPGQNLIRLKQHASYAWHQWKTNDRWRASVGDAVQVNGKYGPHVFVLTEVRYDHTGKPISCDHADYGQFLDPDANGPLKSDHGCRLYVDQPIRQTASGQWLVNGAPVIGHVDILAIAERELGLGKPTPKAAPRVLRVTMPRMVGVDVAAVQRIVGARVDDPEKGIGIYGPLTRAAVEQWQRDRGLLGMRGVEPGVWGHLERQRADHDTEPGGFRICDSEPPREQ